MNIALLVNIVITGVMVFNATFNNISVISWRSVLLVEEIGVPGENHQPATIVITYSTNAMGTGVLQYELLLDQFYLLFIF